MSPTSALARTDGSGVVAAVRRCLVNVATSLKVLFLPVRGQPVKTAPFTWRPIAFTAAICAVAFALGMVFVDATVANSVKKVPLSIVAFFREITDFGKGAWWAWPLGILFLVFAAIPRARLTVMSQRVLDAAMVRAGFLFVAIGLPGLFSSLIKNMIGRMRPPLASVDANPFIFDPFHWAPAYASFPSGHATTAFAAFAAVSMLWPRLRPIMLVYAVLIALSRIFITAHYVTDVCGGALVGIVGALLIRHWFALRRLGFAARPDGALVQYPGPSLKRLKAVARELLS